MKYATIRATFLATTMAVCPLLTHRAYAASVVLTSAIGDLTRHIITISGQDFNDGPIVTLGTAPLVVISSNACGTDSA